MLGPNPGPGSRAVIIHKTACVGRQKCPALRGKGVALPSGRVAGRGSCSTGTAGGWLRRHTDEASRPASREKDVADEAAPPARQR